MAFGSVATLLSDLIYRAARPRRGERMLLKLILIEGRRRVTRSRLRGLNIRKGRADE